MISAKAFYRFFTTFYCDKTFNTLKKKNYFHFAYLLDFLNLNIQSNIIYIAIDKYFLILFKNLSLKIAFKIIYKCMKTIFQLLLVLRAIKTLIYFI